MAQTHGTSWNTLKHAYETHGFIQIIQIPPKYLFVSLAPVDHRWSPLAFSGPSAVSKCSVKNEWPLWRWPEIFDFWPEMANQPELHVWFIHGFTVLPHDISWFLQGFELMKKNCLKSHVLCFTWHMDVLKQRTSLVILVGCWAIGCHWCQAHSGTSRPYAV